MSIARSVPSGRAINTTCSTPATTATVKAWTGYVRRKTTGTAKPRRISRVSSTAGQVPNADTGEDEDETTWPPEDTCVLFVAVPTAVVIPSSSRKAAGTPSTSFGWRLSQAYTADTLPA